MKVLNVFLLASLILHILSCSGDKKIENNKWDLTYEESFNAWNRLKKKNGESYEYQTEFNSFSGFSSVTTITVLKNKVIQRTFQQYKLTDNGKKVKTEHSYFENENELGNNQAGAPAATIDMLYDSCINKYLKINSEQNTIYFSTHDNGILKSCGYIPKYCMDDCFTGVTIKSFKWLD